MTSLVVPMRVDALRLEHPLDVVGAPMDPSTLPRRGDHRDHYPGTPNLAAAITVEPFAEQNHRLEPGVHLHWALPDGLTRGSTEWGPTHPIEVQGLFFPAVPNRWLIMRIDPTAVPARIERFIFVESDHVRTPGGVRPRNASLYVSDDESRSHEFVGRQRAFDSQDELVTALQLDRDGSPRDNRISTPLTALGPGDPTFAALYASCRGVFGAHDDTAPREGTLKYRVQGWYSEADDDPLPRFLDEQRAEVDGYNACRVEVDDAAGRIVFRRSGERTWTERGALGTFDYREETRDDWSVVLQDPARDQWVQLDLFRKWVSVMRPEDGDYVDRHRIVASMRDVRVPLQQRFGWGIDEDLGPELPTGLFCDGVIEIGDASAEGEAPGPTPGSVITDPVAIGSTATEALATWIAHDHDNGTIDAEREDMIEALGFDELFDEHHADLSAAVRSLRHGEQFRETNRRSIWTVRPRRDAQAARDSASPPRGVADLPSGFHRLLAELNELTLAIERERTRLGSQRQRVFADWHAFMEAAYPEIETEPPPVALDALADLVRDGLVPLQLPRAARIDHLVAGLPPDLVPAVRRLEAALRSSPELELVRIPGPRFWRPRDPVVLFGGDHTTPTTRHGHDHLLADGDSLPCTLEDIALEEMASRGPNVAAVSQGTRSWNPLFFEWAVEVRPAGVAGNHAAPHARYDPDFLLANYEWPSDDPELEPREADLDVVGGYKYLSGRTILSPHAQRVIEERIDTLTERIRAHTEDPDDPEAWVRPDWLDTLVDELATAPALSQSLGGFHDALLMRSATRQLPIADPLGFDHQQRLAAEVAQHIGDQPTMSPLHDHPFHPIRTGEMVVERFRIIDSFGQHVDWRPSKVIGAEGYRTGVDGRRISLAPRLAQSARLNFRWLSGIDTAREADEGPVTSPILGWFVRNNLDDDLQVHDIDGSLLGFVDSDGSWRPPPGADSAVRDIASIPEPHVRRVCEWITGSADPADTLERLLASFDTSLAQIDPTDHAQHASRAMLVSQPIALVRAELSIELDGLPASDVSWTAIRSRTHGHDHDDHGFTAVKVPVRIGDHGRWNDGVVGFWREVDGVLFDDFVAPHGDGPIARSGPDGTSGPQYLEQSIDDPPISVSMLIDPRAAVHASSGLLPTKAISVPAPQVAPAVARIAAVFQVMPLLTRTDAIAVPRPVEPDLTWAWLEREKTRWTEVVDDPNGPSPKLAEAALTPTFGTPNVVRDGWLRLAPAPEPESESESESRDGVE